MTCRFFLIVIVVSMLYFSVSFFSNSSSVAIIDRSDIGSSTVVVAGYYSWSSKIPPLHGRPGGGSTTPVSKVLHQESIFEMPLLSRGVNPGFLYDRYVIFKAYVVPHIKLNGSSGTYTAYILSNPLSAGGSHVNEEINLRFIPIRIDPTKPKDLHYRISYLSSLLSRVDELNYEIGSEEILFSGAGKMMRELRPELFHLCKFWKPEHHSKGWRGDREDMPIVCQGVLGVRRYDQLEN